MSTSTRAVVRVLLRDALHRPFIHAASLLLGATLVAGALLQPYAFQNVVDALAWRVPFGQSLTLLACVLLGNLAAMGTLNQVNINREARVALDHRERLLRHAIRLPPYRNSLPPGELLSRYNTDIDAIPTLTSAGLRVGVTTTISLAAFTTLLLVDWIIGLLAAAEIAISLWAARRFVRQQGDAAVRYQTARGELVTRLVDAHQGIRTVRACGTVAREQARVLEPLTAIRAAGMLSWASQREIAWQLATIGPTMRILVLVVAGYGVHLGRLSPGELLAAFLYSRLAVSVLDQIDLLGSMTRMTHSVRRIIEVLELPTVDSPGRSTPLPSGPGEVRIEGVVVRRDGRTVLDGASLAVPAGVHMAVVGRSGSGKSLLVGTIGRLCDPESGRVLLDGRDVRLVDLTELRRQVAYAFEEPKMFGTTVADALTAGRDDADPAAVVRAAQVARADAFVTRLPDGYATPLTRAPLSGGEVQRLGLARAVALPARVIVLDDAGSSLDAATEAEIAAALRTVWQGRTALIVTHRASTAADADLVAWLDAGRIRAVAPHRDLWSVPAYRNVFHGAEVAA